jgi:23S rRNA pseudouridine2605 synthase
MPVERLQKIIAAAGIASRRKAEELITSGRVVVNGQVVTELGSKADPDQDHIRVDGKLLQGPERFVYVALNKPKGYVTTVSDEKKRPTVMDLVEKVKGRVYPVGRLDWASEGLILMTNDGALANGLMKASSNVPKVYVVKVAGQPDETKLDKLRRGVSIAEKGGRRVRTAPAKIRLIREGDNPWLEVTIIEGRNRQVRKMFEEVGHHVEKIRRVQYGPLALDIPPGDWRNLTLLEVAKLKSAAAGVRVASPPTPPIQLRPSKAAASKVPARMPLAAKPSLSPRSSKFPTRPRPARPDHSDRPKFSTRPFKKSDSENKAARSERPSSSFRPQKPSSSSRPERPSPSFRSARPSLSSRSERPSSSSRPPRPSSSSRPAGSFSRSPKPSRPARTSGSKPPRFQKRPRD